MTDAIGALIAAEALPPAYRDIVEGYWAPLADRIAGAGRRPMVVGINGAQGSGKSTCCRFLEVLLAERGLHAVTLSLDDLYLTKAERQELARSLHPLFATRGVPGTHDVGLGNAVIDAVMAGRPFTIPRFDKAQDDRAPGGQAVDKPVDVLLFEGWFLGTRAQPEAALVEPLNALERDEDPDGTWRREANRRLATDYAGLFARVDLLALLKVGSFEDVRANRRLQEEKLARKNPGAPGLMDAASLDRFIMHYERITRWTLEDLPGRCDVLIPIGKMQNPQDLIWNNP